MHYYQIGFVKCHLKMIRVASDNEMKEKRKRIKEIKTASTHKVTICEQVDLLGASSLSPYQSAFLRE